MWKCSLKNLSKQGKLNCSRMKNLIASAYFCWNSISQTLWHGTHWSCEAANILKSKKERKKKQIPTLNNQFTIFNYREE